jgi:hypothetical protein
LLHLVGDLFELYDNEGKLLHHVGDLFDLYDDARKIVASGW